MGCPAVLVLVDDPFLAEAIVRALRLDFGERAGRLDDAASAVAGNLVLAVPSSCDLDLARELVGQGGKLLILAPHLDRKTREDYERAGAHVALMDSRTLTAQVRAVLAGACQSTGASVRGAPRFPADGEGGGLDPPGET